MKRNFIDKAIGFISPKAELKRLQYRRAGEIVRAYDSASNFNTGDWITAKGTSAISEIRQGQVTTRDRGRDLVRNSPYANKAINVIVSNTVGAGIVPKIKGRTPRQAAQLTKEWKDWAESTQCDFDGRHNFYGLQAQALRATVESGEILAHKLIKNEVAKLRLLEPDYLNRNLSNNVDNVEGIWIDKESGQITGYELYDVHPGDFRALSLKSQRYSADEIIHTFKSERVGQLRGISWFYPVAMALKDFSDYQNATLVRQKVSACFTAFITEKPGDGLLDADILRTQREADNSLEPAAIRYLAEGQSIQLANPPGVDQYDPFTRQTLRSVAAGMGISYESISGDYSQVNFSSGRMGHLEMQRNIDMWRWQMLIPGFCYPAFEYFLSWCRIRGIDTRGASADWTCPAREMIDPTKEIASLKDEVRSGFKTLPEAIRERGLDPDAVLEEAAEFNAKLDEKKLIFDTDPRNINAQGMMQMISEPADPNAETGNGENDSGQTDKTKNPKSSNQSRAK